MNNYDLSVVFSGGITPVKKKALHKKLEDMVKGMKGKVSKVDDWGELELSYDIGKNKTGVFLHFNLELEAEAAKDIDKKLNMEEGIIRYLLVRKDN